VQNRPSILIALALMLAAALAAPAQAQEPGVLRGRVVAADGARPDSLRAFVRWRAVGDTAVRMDSAAVDSAGRFALPIPAGAADSLQLIVDAADRTRRAYHPALARIHRREAQAEQGIVLVPRRWTLAGGRYAGQAVEISPHRARTPVCPRCSVFWVRMQSPGQEAVRFQGWPMSRFPLRVGFDRAHSMPVGAAPDSAAFWLGVDNVEDAFGMDLFRPVRSPQTLAQGIEGMSPTDVVLVLIDPSLPVAGLTMVLGPPGIVEYAAVSLQRRDVVRTTYGAELVAHEMMHALGFGHTCAWRSISADITRCPQLRTPVPSPEDVAHAQVLYRVRDLQRAGGLRWGLDAATAGERVLVLGIPADDP
ncbi:MAG TPA: hypothetical protein VFT45_02380, partial [Longimicrobium sp.]|nr:hypothetical protein [Longimicrobium sp.]